MVDYSAIEQIIKEHPDAPWQLRQIDNGAADISPHYCHNAVDSASMGIAEWLQFGVGLVEYFGLTADVGEDEDEDG